MVVMKFGGTSVGDAKAFARVCGIVQAQREDNPDPDSRFVVVTSAMAGVTDILISAAKASAAGKGEALGDIRSELLVRHMSVAGECIADDQERQRIGQTLDSRLAEFERWCESIAVLGELTLRTLDVISSLGEQLSAPLLSATLNETGVPAVFVDGTELIVTDRTHGVAAPDMSMTIERSRERLLPLLQEGQVAVVSGFRAATADGEVTTLGRGGSDYSASILGAALDADEVQIWTDVDGVMTADPRVVATARTLKEISFEEVAELAYFGARVLHPRTIQPVIDKGVRLRVRNSFNPGHPGTMIVRQAKSWPNGGVRALSVIRGMALMTIGGRGMIGVTGIAARTFGSVAGVDANVLLISQSSSEQSICFVVPEHSSESVSEALAREFSRELAERQIDRIETLDQIVVLAAVGAGMRGTHGVAGRLFSALAESKINVVVIAQGASETNISLVVAEQDAARALNVIHAAFALHEPSSGGEN